MKKLERIAVFCGSSLGLDDSFRKAAESLGKEMAKRSIGLVYGGGNKGIMGIIAQSVYNNGGEVIGVLPEAMNIPAVTDNSVHTKLIIVPDMHERKKTMYSLSDGFAALPGGIGTIEELSEIYTWRGLNYHTKNIGLLNTEHFWDPFILQMDKCVEQGFLSKEARGVLISETDPVELLTKLMKEPVSLPSKL